MADRSLRVLEDDANFRLKVALQFPDLSRKTTTPHQYFLFVLKYVDSCFYAKIFIMILSFGFDFNYLDISRVILCVELPDKSMPIYLSHFS